MTKRVKILATRGPKVAPISAATEYIAPYSNERMVGNNGEINASDKRDLLRQSAHFIQAAADGRLMGNGMLTAAQEFQREQTNKELLTAAFNDPTAHRLLGQKMADALYVTGNREGYLRRILAYSQVAQGQVPRVKMYTKDVTAVYATGPTQIQSQIVRSDWFNPPELDIATRLFVTNKEMSQSADDVLKEKFIEAQEAMMVAEDRLLIRAANAVVGQSNELTITGSSLTPASFYTVSDKLRRWGLNAPTAVFATDLMRDIIGSPEFIDAIDPVARHELLVTGRIGTLYGTQLIIDATRHRAHKVINAGEFFIFADPENLGAYSDRGGIVSEPISSALEGKIGRGWLLSELFAMALANPRAVAKGIRAPLY